MPTRRPRSLRPLLPIALVLVCAIASEHAFAQRTGPADDTATACSVDLSMPGMMKDIVSNALMHGIRRPEREVRAFLRGAHDRFTSGDALLRAAAKHFGLTEARLASEVERYRHCNCSHAGGGGSTSNRTLDRIDDDDRRDEAPSIERDKVSPFARNVVLHVVLHELGHALVREFDLPILGNEETLADAFATHYLTTHLPDRAPAVLEARVRSLMIEASEVPRAKWPVRGEHNSDARRAYQIAALAVAADPAKYARVAAVVGMSEADRKRARDYGPEIHRSWRRILKPLWMPAGTGSNEARVRIDKSCSIAKQLDAAGVTDLLRDVVRRFDWHSQVTIRFVEGDGGAGWSRSKRTVTVHSRYVRRFIAQGKIAKRAK